jgi:hypothetical protein
MVMSRHAKLRLRRKLARAALLEHWIAKGRKADSVRRFCNIAFG